MILVRLALLAALLLAFAGHARAGDAVYPYVTQGAVPGNCIKGGPSVSNGQLVDAGGPCLVTGLQAATALAALPGDCVVSALGGFTCIASNGVPFSPIATGSFVANAGVTLAGIGPFGPIGAHAFPQGFIKATGPYGVPIFIAYY